MRRKSILELKQEADVAEDIAKKDLQAHGYTVTKMTKGADFTVIHKDNPDDKFLVEVKLRNGKLSKLQKSTKRLCKKNGIHYLVYPVSGKFFENYNEQKSSHQTSDVSLATVGKPNPKKLKIRNPTTCPNCNLDAAGVEEIIKVFGLRTMEDNTIREQSWCKKCRRKSK